MIARLTGKLAETTADSAVIDVGGVGYLVLASTRTLDALGPVGSDVLLLTDMQVREDSMTLFGFGTAGERESFRVLTSVQGVGGRVALAILSTLSPDDLSRAVSTGDKAMISRANGVGPKLAMRIANELQGKLGAPGLAGTAGAPTLHASAAVRGPWSVRAGRSPTSSCLRWPPAPSTGDGAPPARCESGPSSWTCDQDSFIRFSCRAGPPRRTRRPRLSAGVP